MTIVCPQLGNSGRLGNQLWQIASTIGIADSQKEDVSLPAWAYMNYFCIPHEFFDNRPGIRSDEFVPYMPPDAKIYLQDYNLISNIEEQIKQWFQPSKLALETLMTYKDFWSLEPPVLSIHVRRGDNANEGDWKAKYHPLRPLSYYRDAQELLKGQYQSVAVFSDDPEWCMKNLSADYYHVGTPRPKEHEEAYKIAPVLDWIDLQMQIFADKHILSNSTYSWWGAFLSDDPSPVYPVPFFGVNLSHIDASLMFPPDWQKIDHGILYAN